MSSKRGILFVVSAPSGTGKTTLCRMLLDSTEGLVFSVSYTTRKPRKGEIHGKDYFFVSKETFEEMIKNGEFLEWAEVHGNYYGTSKEQVLKALKEGKDVLLDIDTQGAVEVKKNFPDAVLIFIAPPSLEELKRRLVKRGTESEEAIKKRLQNARTEIARARFYDYIVINDVLEVALEDLKAIIKAEKCRAERVISSYGGLPWERGSP